MYLWLLGKRHVYTIYAVLAYPWPDSTALAEASISRSNLLKRYIQNRLLPLCCILNASEKR